MKDFKSVAKTMWFHTKILWKGFTRMLCGTITAGLIALAVYGFIMIPSEGGWAAVSDFICGIVLMSIALGCVYAMGAGYKKGAKR